MQCAVIVQARMSSRRLSGKSLRPLAGRPLIDWVLAMAAAAAARSRDPVLLATSTDPSDDALADRALAAGAGCFRGDLLDVAERLASAAESVGAESFVRICGDSPLIAPALIAEVRDRHLLSGAEFTSNAIAPRTFPAGQSVEVIRTAVLRHHLASLDAHDREHVTPWFHRTAVIHRDAVRAASDMSDVPMTVDTEADLARLDGAFRRLADPVGATLQERIRAVTG
ncbi:MAG: hypothetical protein KF817_15665 [Phycisphaeraceae bacterium]|nr:hypothetical protein [Phycisphaeraceae bacterium]